MSLKLSVIVYRDGVTGGLQLIIRKTDAAGVGSGYRLAGPKFNGTSQAILTRDLTEEDAAEIRRYLDAVYPPEVAR